MNILTDWIPKSGYSMAVAPTFGCYAESFDPVLPIGNVEIWIPIKYPVQAGQR
jgi:predicted transcriptional regulator YdeE